MHLSSAENCGPATAGTPRGLRLRAFRKGPGDADTADFRIPARAFARSAERELRSLFPGVPLRFRESVEGVNVADMEQTSAGRGRYHHGALKESLIEGARRLLAEKGATGFSLHELARRVGVSVAAPYRHFESRDALLGAVAARGYEELLQILGESLDQTADPVDQLRHFGVCYLQFAIDNPELFAIMFTDRYRAETEAAQRASFEPMTEFVARAQETGALTPDVPAPEIARFLWATAHGLTVLHLNGGFQALGIDNTPRALVDSAWSAFLGVPPRKNAAG